jgi:hypothetical protein
VTVLVLQVRDMANTPGNQDRIVLSNAVLMPSFGIAEGGGAI